MQDPDAPPPPVVKPLPAPAEQPPQELTANQRLLLSTGLALGINTSNPPSPPKTQVRPLLPHTCVSVGQPLGALLVGTHGCRHSLSLRRPKTQPATVHTAPGQALLRANIAARARVHLASTEFRAPRYVCGA